MKMKMAKYRLSKSASKSLSAAYRHRAARAYLFEKKKISRKNLFIKINLYLRGASKKKNEESAWRKAKKIASKNEKAKK